MSLPPVASEAETATAPAHTPVAGRAEVLAIPALYATAVLAQGGVPSPGTLGLLGAAAGGAAAATAAIRRLAALREAGEAAAGPPATARRRPRLGRVLALWALALSGALVLLVTAGQLAAPGPHLSLLPVAAFVLVLAPAQPAAATERPRGVAGRAARAAVAHAMVPLAAWAAIQQRVEGPAWLVAAAVGCWAAASWLATELALRPLSPDTGMLDGTPITIRLAWARAAHGAGAALWVAVGWAAGRGPAFFIGAVAAALLLMTADRVMAVDPRDPARIARALVGMAWAVPLILAAILLDARFGGHGGP